eukprot:gene46779-57286_t
MKRYIETEHFESSWFYLGAIFRVMLALLVLLPGPNCSTLFHRGKDAKIILHIGPSKTGSTHFQGQTLLMASMLNEAGFCKNGSDFVKLEHAFSLEIEANSHRHLKDFYKRCLDSGKRVIISSEAFSAYQRHSQFAALKRFIGTNSVHIVAVYREPLTRLQSAHSQITKGAQGVVQSFGTFAMENAWLKGAFFYSFIDRYVQHFGRQNITVLDYYGMEAIGRDVTR